MRKINIVIMGKTGAGKCTLVNTLVGKTVAINMHIPPYGVDELLNLTIEEYGLIKGMARDHKMGLLQSKIDKPERKTEEEVARRREKQRRKSKQLPRQPSHQAVFSGFRFFPWQAEV